MPDRTCTIDGCQRPHQARGLCGSHYNQAHAKPAPTFTAPCSQCGQVIERNHRPKATQRFCARRCVDAWNRDHPKPKKPKPIKPAYIAPDRRSPLRRAYEAADAAAFVAGLRTVAMTTPDGCWLWPKSKCSDGYARMVIGNKRHKTVHRALAELRWPHLGTLPVHHLCANRACVNPDHHVPASHAENVAEMLARKWYEGRIAQLENALAALDPSHPSLPGGTPLVAA